MILDVYTQPISFSLPPGDLGLLVVVLAIVFVASLPFMGGGGRR